MNTLFKIRHLAFRLKLPAALLVTLLQRLPVLPVARALSSVVAESPVSAILKSAFATAASLGAIHSLAGATVLSTTQASPFNVTVGKAITPVGFTVTNTINIASWKIAGALPPGLSLVASENTTVAVSGPGMLDATTGGTDDGYGGATGGIVSTTPALMGTPTAAGSYTFSLQAYESPRLSGLASNTFNFTVVVTGNATVTAPSFTTQPQSQTAGAGGTVTFTAVIAGTAPITYQWNKNGAPVNGATAGSLTLSNLTAADAATYTLVATNSAGAVTSSGAVLTISASAGGAPSITMQPLSVIANTGGTVALVAGATNAVSYQWRKDGVAIGGATNSALVLTGVSAANVGAYIVVVSNPSGSATSAIATVGVTTTTNIGHLVNLSILTNLAAGSPLTVGAVLGGGGHQRLQARARSRGRTFAHASRCGGCDCGSEARFVFRQHDRGDE